MHYRAHIVVQVFFAGEFGWITPSGGLGQFLSAAASTPGVNGAAFWSLFPHWDTYGWEQHNDGFTLWWPGVGESMVDAAEALRAFAYNMSGASQPPALPAPGQPLITSGSIAQKTVAWRGAVGV